MLQWFVQQFALKALSESSHIYIYIYVSTTKMVSHMDASDDLRVTCMLPRAFNLPMFKLLLTRIYLHCKFEGGVD